MAKFCSKCGNPLQENDKFCRKCGAPVRTIAPEPQVQRPAPSYDIPSNDFDNPENKNTYRYFTYVYKTNDAFWMVQFATLKSNSEKLSQEIAEWAKSVTFSN